jgi:hypothetical protein
VEENYTIDKFLSVLDHHNFNILKVLCDTNPSSLESGLDLLIEIFSKISISNLQEKDSTLLNDIFKFTIEKAYACTKTPVKLKSKDLIILLLEKSKEPDNLLNQLISLLQFSPKKAKTVIYALQILQYVITQFGCGQDSIDFKIFMPSLIKLIEGSNHGTRYETYEIIKEVYKWVKGEVMPFVENLKEMYKKEIKNQFEKIDEMMLQSPVKSNKIWRRNIENIQKNENFTKNSENEENFEMLNKKSENPSKIEKLNDNLTKIEKSEKISLNNKSDFSEYNTTPISLSKKSINFSDLYNQDWVENLLSKDKKWNDKKDLLDNATNTLNSNKISSQDFTENSVIYESIFSALKQLLKDSNINVVLSSLSTITAFSSQLGTSFSPYAKEYLPLILDKFREKKDKLNKEIMNTLTSLLKCNITLDEVIGVFINIPSDKSNQYKLNVCEFIFIILGKTFKNVIRNCLNDLICLFVKLTDETNNEVKNSAFNCLSLIKLRMGDEAQSKEEYKNLSEIKKNKIDEITKSMSYDKLYDIEQINENDKSNKIKINRKKSEIKDDNLNENSSNSNIIKVNRNNREKENVDFNENFKDDDIAKDNNLKDKLENTNINIATQKDSDSLETFSLNKPKSHDDVPLKGIKKEPETDDSHFNTTAPVNDTTLPSSTSEENKGPYNKNQQQADLDEFTRKLEEAMKKESEKIDTGVSKPVKHVVKKPVVKRDSSNKDKIENVVVNNVSSSNNTTVNNNVAATASKTVAKPSTSKDEEEDEISGKLNKAEVEEKINTLIGEEIATLLSSPKWEEKKSGLSSLNDWLANNSSSASSNMENIIIFMKIKLKDYKESNFNIIREACNVYITLISIKGFDKRLATLLIKGLFEKIGEAKLKEHISNLIFILMENIGPKFTMTNILKHLNNDKKVPSNTILREYASVFEKSLEDFGISLVPVKEIVEYCKVLSSNTNPQVRNSSTTLLCSLYKFIGKDLKVLLKDIKESTLKVIEGEFEKVKIYDNVNSMPNAKRELKGIALKDEGKGTGTNNKKDNSHSASGSANLMDSLIPRSDISKKLNAKLLKDINTGKWPEKKEASEAIEKILSDANNKILPNGLSELFTVFKARLSDGNKNVVRLIVNLLTKLIESLGAGFKNGNFIKTIGAPLINNLSDKMLLLREDVLICMDKWVINAGFDSIVPFIPALLKSDNFEMRTELFKFFSKNKDNFLSVKFTYDLKEFVSPLLTCLQDKSLPIRNSAEEYISYFISNKLVTFNNFTAGLKDFKPAIANTLKNILEKYDEGGLDGLTNPMSHSTILTKDKSGDLNLNTINAKSNNNAAKTAASSSNVNSLTPEKSKKASSNVTSRHSKIEITNNKQNKKSNDEDFPLASNSTTINAKVSTSKILGNNKTLSKNKLGNNQSTNASTNPVLGNTSRKTGNATPNLFLISPSIKMNKEKRTENDKKFKFSLDTITDDMVNKLKEAMKTFMYPEFVDKLYHEDLKFTIEGINHLHNYLKENWNESNPLPYNIFEYLDLLLKYIGWRSNSNQNPMLVKSVLELFETLSNVINSSEYEFTETEGFIVLSILVDKLGNSNAKFREISRALMEKFVIPGKFSHLINLSMSRNSKVKVECLEICTGIIASCGSHLAPNKDLKYLAKLLTVNDIPLRNAIVNLLAEVYVQVKDNLWNVLTDIPDKIKEMLYAKFFNAGLVEVENHEEENQDENEESDNREYTVTNTMGNIREGISGNTITVTDSPNLTKGNNAITNKSTNKPNTASTSRLSNAGNTLNTSNPTGNKSRLTSDNNLIKITNNTENQNNKINSLKNIQSNTIPSNDNNPSTSSSKTYSNISTFTVNDTNDLNTILIHLNAGEMSERVNVILIIHELVFTKFAQSKHILIPNIDAIIKAFVISLKNLFKNKSLQEIPIKLGKYLLTVLYKISSNKELIVNISYEVLFNLTEEVLSNLLIENLDKVGENQEGVIIIRSLNSTMLRVLENCNYTHVISVLLELVKKYRKNENKVKISGLAIKCLLKINQILPQIIDNIQVDKILNKINEMLIDFEETNPGLVANNQTDQMVIRYIKNLINELVKIRKDAIKLDYLKALDNTNNKDKYLKRWITNILSSMSPGNNINMNNFNTVSNNNVDINDLNYSRNTMNTGNNYRENNLMMSQSFIDNRGFNYDTNSTIGNNQYNYNGNNIDNLIAYKNRLKESNVSFNK